MSKDKQNQKLDSVRIDMSVLAPMIKDITTLEKWAIVTGKGSTLMLQHSNAYDSLEEAEAAISKLDTPGLWVIVHQTISVVKKYNIETLVSEID